MGPFHDSDLGSFDAGYSPSIDPGAATIDVGGVSSHMDDSTALSHAFIDRHKPFLSKMPWENSIMEPIFGDPSSVQSLGMPSSWSVDISQPVPATEQLERLKTKATDIDSCVKSKVDRSFIDAKAFDMKRAVGKLSFFLHLDLQSSGVGRQLIFCPHETDEIIRAVVGVKSPTPSSATTGGTAFTWKELVIRCRRDSSGNI